MASGSCSTIRYSVSTLDGCEAAIEDYQHGIDDNIVGEFIHTLQSYSEYSVSGKGIHILCRGALPPGGRRKRNVEMYDTPAVFIMTGNRCAAYKHFETAPTPSSRFMKNTSAAGWPLLRPLSPVLPMNLSDAEIIRMAEQSKQGQMFSDLWSGNWQPYHTKPVRG